MLTSVVLVQSVDLIWCADEVLDGGVVESSMAASSMPTASHPTSEIADCLCHVIFTPTTHLPTIAPPVVRAFLYLSIDVSVAGRHLTPQGPVPLT